MHSPDERSISEQCTLSQHTIESDSSILAMKCNTTFLIKYVSLMWCEAGRSEVVRTLALSAPRVAPFPALFVDLPQ